MEHTIRTRSQAVVVIPVYRSEPTPDERASLARTVCVLGRWPLVLLHPEGTDPAAILHEFPQLRPLAVSDEWLGTRNGIAGYNRMMLSASFYDLFADEAEYLLVCHTDAWIFRDELADWCARGFDCVAAPWVRRPVYDLPLVRQWLELRRRRADRRGERLRQHLYGRIGNGGLSLRRVEAFRAACDRYRAEAERFAAVRHHLCNEDVFWATVPAEFRYPDWHEALGFAFDTNPAYCYRLSNGHLPFGCHGWSKPRMRRFWEPFIPPAAVPPTKR